MKSYILANIPGIGAAGEVMWSEQKGLQAHAPVLERLQAATAPVNRFWGAIPGVSGWDRVVKRYDAVLDLLHTVFPQAKVSLYPPLDTLEGRRIVGRQPVF